MFELGNAFKNSLIKDNNSNKYYNDDIVIDLKDLNNTKSIIYRRVKKKSHCLDVGCGAGILSEVLKKKKCIVDGVDYDKAALKVAEKKNNNRHLYQFCISPFKGKDLKKFISDNNKYDYIIFADVLEHVIDPDNVINFFKSYLKEDGKIILSLPNIAHFDIIKGLIDGNFNYNHIGLLDSTHYRFYTKKSFYDFVNDYNEKYDMKLHINIIGKTIIEPDYMYKYNSINKLLNKNNESCVLQFVYELDNSGKMNNSEIIENMDFIEKTLEDYSRIVEENLILKQQIESILNSKSWKITKPLRYIVNKMKG